MNSKSPSKKLLALNWLILVTLHFAILGSAYLNLGHANTPLMAALVFLQTILIIMFFMEVRYNTKLVWIFSAAGFFWLALQFTLVAGDYLTRSWH